MFGNYFAMVLRSLIFLVLMFTDTTQHKDGPPSNTNIASGKPTSQSSTKDGAASNAVDGDYKQTKRFCSLTEDDDQAWWTVDLLDAYNIGCLKIYGRGDRDLLSDFKIYVGNEVDNVIQYSPCYKYYGEFGTSASCVPCNTTSRYRYVKIQLGAYNTPLSLCEVMIYSKEDMPTECQSFDKNVTLAISSNGFDVTASEVRVQPSTSVEPEGRTIFLEDETKTPVEMASKTVYSEQAATPSYVKTIFSDLDTKKTGVILPLTPSSKDMFDFSILTSSKLEVVTPVIDFSFSQELKVMTLISIDDVLTDMLYPSVIIQSSDNAAHIYDFSRDNSRQLQSTSTYRIDFPMSSVSVEELSTFGDVSMTASDVSIARLTPSLDSASIFIQSSVALDEWSTSDHGTMTTSSDWLTTSLPPSLNESVPAGKEMACLCGCRDKKRLDLKILHWKLPLRLKKTDTSLYRRSKESADNIKFSSKCIGVFGLGIVLTLSVLVLVIDLHEMGTNLFCFKFKSNQFNKTVGRRF